MSRNVKNMLHLWEMIQSAKFGVKQTQCATVGLNTAKWGISGLLISISFTVNKGWELRIKHLFGIHYGFQKHLRTREHSGRMRKVHLETVHASVVPTRCHSRGPSSEQVWTGLQCWPPDVSRTGGSSQVWCPGDAYHITYPMMHLMLLTHPVDRQTPVKTLPSQNFVCER